MEIATSGAEAGQPDGSGGHAERVAAPHCADTGDTLPHGDRSLSALTRVSRSSSCASAPPPGALPGALRSCPRHDQLTAGTQEMPAVGWGGDGEWSLAPLPQGTDLVPKGT